MTRFAHYVGSLPAELMTGDRAVMQWFADHSEGRPVTALPCDLDPDWIMDYLRTRKQHADVFEIVRAGEYADYGDFPSYGLRSGCTLEPRHVSMNRVERIGRVVEAFESLRSDRPELATTKVQISQPNPLDLAMFVFAAAAVSGGLPVWPAVRRSGLVVDALRQLPVFTEAVVQEMAEIVERYGDRVVWQLESPIALLSMVKAEQLRSQWALAPLVARQLAGVLGRMHEIGAEAIVHLCYGDYQHKSLLSPRTLAPAVKLLGRTARLLREQGTPLPPVHIPCAYGAEPAPQDPRFYAPLRKLDPDWKVIAGVVSPDSGEDSARALALFEQAAGRAAYGVATACGLGRCTVDAARQAAATTVTLAGAGDGREQ
ncbi:MULTISPECIES: hypothetical protein [Nocardia]|uniref:Uroporphyrinogen decarboxylase (URO-D) domain-containing protein n=1 Tax=Nocardia sputorum TaxID=2984338 RepID=A0ABM8CX52_9NOCA|nr:hypothetical protein [Nocardia sputorum]BDT90942.1 hypothetical protein IFM12275_09180 [Nocardia sputorum]BDT99574.1 hypothetical protein IFM12276_26030 [Nocardia sputorum]